MTEMTHRDGSAADEVDGPVDVPAGGREPAQPRCPSCGALRPPAVSWCTQCYARLDDPGTDDPGTDDPGTDDPGTDDPGTPAPVAPRVPAAGAQPEGGVHPDLGVHPELGPAQRSARPVPAVPPEEVQARAEELLARLAEEGAAGHRVRSWSGLVQGNGRKVAAIVVGTLVLTALLFGAMAVLGALL